MTDPNAPWRELIHHLLVGYHCGTCGATLYLGTIAKDLAPRVRQAVEDGLDAVGKREGMVWIGGREAGIAAALRALRGET